MALVRVARNKKMKNKGPKLMYSGSVEKISVRAINAEPLSVLMKVNLISRDKFPILS